MGKKKQKLLESTIEVKRLRSRVAELYSQGYRPMDIAVICGISDVSVSKYMKQIYEEWKKTDPVERREHLHRRLMELDLIHRWAAVAFQRSQENAEKVSTVYEPQACRDCLGNPGFLRGEMEATEWCPSCEGRGYHTREVVTKVSSGQAGDPAFLKVMESVTREKGRLLGLHPNKRAEPHGLNMINNIVTKVESKGNRFLNAPPELILEALQSMSKLESAASKDKVIEVE